MTRRFWHNGLTTTRAQPCLRPGDPRLARTILLTNIVLAGRSGTEVVTEQLADGLRRRGHEVLVFAPQIGPLGEAMRLRGHRVADRPGDLPRPDIIHAHHTGPAMAALVAHPGVPALFVSHDATAPFDAAPPHPRIRRIFAVDERCRARLLADGAPPGTVGLLPNGVDLTRIPLRSRPLPARPARALVLAKHSAHLAAIRAACAAAGIVLDIQGGAVGRVSDAPERLAAEADLVFATARTALEAAAAGAGVVVCDARGCAGFLTRARAEAWLPWNLGAGILSQPAEQGPIAAAIAEWSAAEVAGATALVRKEHDLEALLDRIEVLHAEVLAEPARADPAAEAAATAAFIAGWVPNFDLRAPWRRLSLAVGGTTPIEALPDQVVALSERIDRMAEAEAQRSQQGEAAAAARSAAEVAVLRAEIAVLRAEMAARFERTEVLLLRQGPLRRAAGAAWRALVPHAIRAPLRRWRTGRLDHAGTPGG